MIGKSNSFTVKVPEGLIQKSNLQSSTYLLKLWYELKSKHNSGHFISIKQIHSVTSESFSSIYKKVEKMIKLNWIKKDKNGYTLISYDKLFKIFGYEMSLKKTKNGFRAGNFKIFKINIENFLNNIYKSEIKLNFQRQFYRINKKLTQKKVKVDTSNRVNKEITLSSRGISRIFGFKSSSTGIKIEQSLEKAKVLQIIRRPISYNYNLPNLLIFL